jgi:adenine phosphoribosyltransferase
VSSGSSRGALDAALALVREVPDFPQQGVLFRDLGPVFADGPAFRALTHALVDTLGEGVDLVAAVEARGFLLGAAVGIATGLGVVAVRKPGKTPVVADRAEYQLEYGTAALELPAGLVTPGKRVAVIDDVLATGGTAAATCTLLERAGAVVGGVSVVLELGALGGRERLGSYQVHALATV